MTLRDIIHVLIDTPLLSLVTWAVAAFLSVYFVCVVFAIVAQIPAGIAEFWNLIRRKP